MQSKPTVCSRSMDFRHLALMSIVVLASASAARADAVFVYDPITESILSATFTADFAALTAHRTAFGQEVNRASLIDLTTGLGDFDMSDDLFGTAAWPNVPAVAMGGVQTGLITASINPSFFPALEGGRVGLNALFTDTDDALFAIDFVSLSIETASGTTETLYGGPIGNENDGYGLGILDGADLPGLMPGVLLPTGTGFDEEISSKNIIPEPASLALLALGTLALLGRRSGRRLGAPATALRGASRQLLLIVAAALTLLSYSVAARAADPFEQDLVRGDPAAATIVQYLQTLDPTEEVQVLAKHRQTDQVTGYTYTLLKAESGMLEWLATINEDTGTFALDDRLAERERAALLESLPPVYSIMEAGLLRRVRLAQRGVLGADVGLDTPIRVTFVTDTAVGLEAILAALGDTPVEIYDAAALWAEHPPIVRPDNQGRIANPPVTPQTRTVSAELPLSEVLRVGALPSVTYVEPTMLATQRLDLSVPHIKADTVNGFGLLGANADIGIVDGGIDAGHPNLAGRVFAQGGFVNRTCNGGANNGNRCDCLRNGTCVAGVCVGGDRAGLACEAAACPGGACAEDPFDDTDGHGTHVAGIAANSSVAFGGMAPQAELINAKAIPAPRANVGDALNFTRQQGADVTNGSYGWVAGETCQWPRVCRAGNVGIACAVDSTCDLPPGAGNGVCNVGFACNNDFTCDVAGFLGTCAAAIPDSDGRSRWALDVDEQVYEHDVTVTVAAEELPYAGRCSNNSSRPCERDFQCGGAGATCLAVASTPNDAFNVITVGAGQVAAPNTCTGPAVCKAGNVGNACAVDSDCDSAPGNGDCNLGDACTNGSQCDIAGQDPGVCNAPFCGWPAVCVGPDESVGTFCLVNADCDFPPFPPGAGNGDCNLGNVCDSDDACQVPGVADQGICLALSWASFSQVGQTSDGRSKPDVLAPGEGLNGDEIDSCAHDWDTDPTPIDDFVDMAGTSMASPHVAGLAALLWAWGDGHDILTDTPYIKATIINTCRRLAGWASPSTQRPLDPKQGAGEVDAEAAFREYADDLRVWQQNVTGTAASESHWYWTDYDGAGPIVVTLVWERHVTDPAAAVPTLNNLDLKLYDPQRAEKDQSNSMVDNVEHIVYTPLDGKPGRYCIEVDPVSLGTGGSELYTVACNYRLHFMGKTCPCHADYGDAPDPFKGAAGKYPTLKASNGARHLDWTKEWLGRKRPKIDGELRKLLPPPPPPDPVKSVVEPFPEVSGEDDADDGNDQDGHINLDNQDGWDKGVGIPGKWIANEEKKLTVVVNTIIDDTGFGPNGRYDKTDSKKRLYLNAWCDWNGDGDWDDAGEKIIGTESPNGTAAIDPEEFGKNSRYTIGEKFVDENGSGQWEPGEPVKDPAAPDPKPSTDIAGATEKVLTYKVRPPAAIADVFYCRFRLDYGEDVGHVDNDISTNNLSEAKGRAVFGEVEDYLQGEPAVNVELDEFPDSRAEIEVFSPLLGTEVVQLTGPTNVIVDFNEIGDADADGLEEVPTEIISMELTGTSTLFGPITVRLRPETSSPFLKTVGEIEETANGTPGVLDLPPFAETGTAISFFDVFFEIDVLGQTYHNLDPKHQETEIHHKPPREDDIYESPGTVVLYDESDLPTDVELRSATHHPQPLEFDFFPNTQAVVEVFSPLFGTEKVIVKGPTEVVVDMGALGDQDLDNREEVPTEIVNMELTGNSTLFGPITVRIRPETSSPFLKSIGEIVEVQDSTPGVLDLPPFTATGTADSFFNIFFEIDVLGQTLHNLDPKRQETVIREKPPAEGDVYENPDPINLYDENDLPTGVQLISASHTPRPVPTPPPDQLHLSGPIPNQVIVGQESTLNGVVEANFVGLPGHDVIFTKMTDPQLTGTYTFTGGTVSPDGSQSTVTTDQNGTARTMFVPDGLGRGMIQATVVGTQLETFSMFEIGAPPSPVGGGRPKPDSGTGSNQGGLGGTGSAGGGAS